MSLEGEQRVIAHHAAAVVHDADELAAAALDLDADAGGTGIKRIFEQLLDHRRRAVHHFAGGDLVSDLVGEYVDAAHGLRVRQGVVENFPDRVGKFAVIRFRESFPARCKSSSGLRIEPPGAGEVLHDVA